MTTRRLWAILSTIYIWASLSGAQTTCSKTLSAAYPAPSVAPGFAARIVANGLTHPRGIIFDTAGNLLVIEQGRGVVAYTLNDAGGSCLTVKTTVVVVQDSLLNHGIDLSEDGKTLYASNSDKAFSWGYDASSVKTTTAATTLVQGMNNTDHNTRTVLASKKVGGMLLVSRGSNANVDPAASDIASGHSQIRAFNVTGIAAPYNYSTAGTLMGWGLRNSVGMAEEPTTGGIWSVENSIDDITRNGADIHNDNPGEELNFHGYLNGTAAREQGANFGYPTCFAAWDLGGIPGDAGLQVGEPFAINDITAANNDSICGSTTVGPRLTFPSHWAPLDIKFNSKGSVAYITSHGSWNRVPPDGYTLFAVAFSAGFPVAPPNSSTSYSFIMRNANNNACPSACFRPVGLAFDRKGRLFMSSDSTGEIYVITSSDGGSIDSKTLNVTGEATNGAGTRMEGRGWVGWLAVFVAMVFWT